MSLSINALKTSLNKYPLLDLSKFKVFITGPKGNLEEQITLRCSNVSLPGRGISTTERFHHGPIRKIPYAEVYDDVTLSFITSDSLAERKFFNDWQTLIGGGNSYNIAWYADIIGTVVIQNLDRKGNVKTTTILYEAFPMTIDPIQFDSNAADQLSLFNVTFAYHHWELQ